MNNTAFFQAALNGRSATPISRAAGEREQAFWPWFPDSGAYTYAHAIDDFFRSAGGIGKTNSFPRNSFALNNERATRIRHPASVVNYAWDLPVGRGRGYLRTGFRAEC